MVIFSIRLWRLLSFDWAHEFILGRNGRLAIPCFNNVLTLIDLWSQSNTIDQVFIKFTVSNIILRHFFELRTFSSTKIWLWLKTFSYHKQVISKRFTKFIFPKQFKTLLLGSVALSSEDSIMHANKHCTHIIDTSRSLSIEELNLAIKLSWKDLS